MAEIIEDADNTFLEYSDPNNPVQVLSDYMISRGLTPDEEACRRLAELNEYCIEKVEVVEQIYVDGKPIIPE